MKRVYYVINFLNNLLHVLTHVDLLHTHRDFSRNVSEFRKTLDKR